MMLSYPLARAALARLQIKVCTDFGLDLFPITINRAGIDWWYKGDTVIWTWPWRRNDKPKWVSLGFSGNGDFGDARFVCLADVDLAWAGLFDAEQQDLCESEDYLFENPCCGGTCGCHEKESI